MPDETPDNVHDGNTQPLPTVGGGAASPDAAPTERIPSAQASADPFAEVPFLAPAEPADAGVAAVETRSRPWVPWLVVGVLAIALVAAALAFLPDMIGGSAVTTPSPTPSQPAPTTPATSPSPPQDNEEPVNPVPEQPAPPPPPPVPAPEEPAPEEPQPEESPEPEPTETPPVPTPAP